jgi:hypothetical protein
MTPDLEKAILGRHPEEEMYNAVRKHGMLTMKEDAIIKSAKGVVPFEEVNSLGGTFDLFDEAEVAPVAEVAKAAALELDAEGESVAEAPKAEPKEKEIQI